MNGELKSRIANCTAREWASGLARRALLSLQRQGATGSGFGSTTIMEFIRKFNIQRQPGGAVTFSNPHSFAAETQKMLRQSTDFFAAAVNATQAKDWVDQKAADIWEHYGDKAKVRGLEQEEAE